MIDRPKRSDCKTPIQIEFGLGVRAIRKTVGWSQEKLAEQSGLHVNYLSSVERGERNISLLNIFRLAKALNCDATQLIKPIGLL